MLGFCPSMYIFICFSHTQVTPLGNAMSRSVSNLGSSSNWYWKKKVKKPFLRFYWFDNNLWILMRDSQSWKTYLYIWFHHSRSINKILHLLKQMWANQLPTIQAYKKFIDYWIFNENKYPTLSSFLLIFQLPPSSSSMEIRTKVDFNQSIT